MNAKQSDASTAKPTSSPCSQTALERNNYFVGKFLTPCDLQREQDYHRTHAHSHNRLLHGWGIVCGLTADLGEGCSTKSDDEGLAGSIVVQPGVAIDMCGREVVLPKEVTLYFAKKSDEKKADEKKADEKKPEESWETMPTQVLPGHHYLLCLQHREVNIEPTTIYCHEGKPGHAHPAFNAKREYGCVVLLDAQKTKELIDCRYWPNPVTKTPDDHRLPPTPHVAPAPGGCLESLPVCEDENSERTACPDILRQNYIPLGLLTWSETKPDYTEEAPQVQTARKTPADYPPAEPELVLRDCGRTYVRDPYGRNLTKIVSVNWTHGKMYATLDEFFQDIGGTTDERQLIVRFDNKLLEDGNRFGVNPATFEVLYSQSQEQFETAAWQSVKLSSDRRAAIFTFNNVHFPKQDQYGKRLNPCMIHISLKCDFLLDCHGQAVDGNNLGGRVPYVAINGKLPPHSPKSGNGVQGGTFESWFWIR